MLLRPVPAPTLKPSRARDDKEIDVESVASMMTRAPERRDER
jgi:hypothetical protein